MMIMMMSNKAVQMVAFAAIAMMTPISATHYEKPPCQSDELAVLMNGVDGTFCSSSCATHPCPTDVPVGVKMAPQCALQSPTGAKYCAILCDPADNGLPCGTQMQCATIPGTNGVGVCDYAKSDTDPATFLLRGSSDTTTTTITATVVLNEMTMGFSAGGFADVDVDVVID
mmetsp:Transcript_47739/g.55103  ORF Transcript_47739/g.55103 Transcript_47739/m.55103 type:complete len:171 (-) Transcript_47739:237-749(-)